MLVCPHCKKEVEALIEVTVKLPAGCTCNPNEWLVDLIPPVCRSFKPILDIPDQCDNCEHNLECHQ